MSGLINTAVDASLSGLGAYLVTSVIQSPTPMRLFGFQGDLLYLDAFAVAGCILFDDLVYKSFIVKYLKNYPRLKEVLNTGNFLGEYVVVSLVPVLLLYMGNTTIPASSILKIIIL